MCSVQLLAKLWTCTGTGVDVDVVMLPAKLEGRPRVSDISSEWSRKVSVPSSAALVGVCGCVVPAPAPVADSSRPVGNDAGPAGSPRAQLSLLGLGAGSAAVVPDVPAAPANEILWVN